MNQTTADFIAKQMIRIIQADLSRVLHISMDYQGGRTYVHVADGAKGILEIGEKVYVRGRNSDDFIEVFTLVGGGIEFMALCTEKEVHSAGLTIPSMISELEIDEFPF